MNQQFPKELYPSNEYGVIEALKQFCCCTSNNAYTLTIGDDAAIRHSGLEEQLVITGDTAVEGVHFDRAYMTLQQIGYRSMAANVSDCASMGSQPDGALVQLIVPWHPDTKEMLIELYRGFHEACVEWHFPIIGGNLSKGPCWIIAITLLGRNSSKDRLLRRTGVQAGDSVWVSGTPGMSAAGLACLKRWNLHEIRDEFQIFVQKHIRPFPQIDLGIQLAHDPSVHAMIDLSDGIAKECHTLAYENNKGIELKQGDNDALYPYASLSKQLQIPWYEWFLYGGEDYELLFTASDAFQPQEYKNYSLAKIGRVLHNDCGVTYTLSDGNKLLVEKRGWDHSR